MQAGTGPPVTRSVCSGCQLSLFSFEKLVLKRTTPFLLFVDLLVLIALSPDLLHCDLISACRVLGFLCIFSTEN